MCYCNAYIIKIMRKKIGMSLIVLVLFLTCWEAATHALTQLQFVLPPPSAIFHQMTHHMDRLFYHSWQTLKVMLGGILLSLLFSFPVAWIMYRWDTASLLLQPLFVVTQCIPMFVLAPIMVLWMGWSFMALVIPTALMIFLPLTMNIYQGLRSTPTHYLDYFRVHQATAWQTFYKLQLPWSLPYLFAGFRIATAISGIGAIAGEWAGAQSGLGLLMLESRRGADLEMMFGALFCLVILSLMLYGAISLLKWMVFRKKFVYLTVANFSTACLLIVMTLTTGCQTTPQNETRLMLDWLPNPNHVPIYVGMEKGYFAKQGISLKIQKIHDAADPLVYLSTGQTEMAISYMPSAIYAIDHGAEIKPIAVLIPQPLNALIYRKESQIKHPGDLNGKVFGYCVDGSSTITLNWLLRKNEISPKEMRNVSFDLVSTVGTGQVDVVYGAFWNIECEQLRALGVDTEHFALVDLGLPTYYELVIMAKNGSEHADEEFVFRFKKALQESIAFCQQEPEEAFELYAKANPDKSEKTLHWEQAAWLKTLPLFSQDLDIDQGLWDRYADFMLIEIKQR